MNKQQQMQPTSIWIPPVLMAVYQVNLGQPLPRCFLPLLVSEENLSNKWFYGSDAILIERNIWTELDDNNSICVQKRPLHIKYRYLGFTKIRWRPGVFVRSLLRAGVQPTLDSSAETFMAVQCASPGRGGELVRVCSVCASCVGRRKG